MSAETILIVFLAFVGAETAISLWLDWLNARHVLARADAPPERFRDSITPAAHERAVKYTLARLRLGVVEEVVDTLVLVAFVLLGGFALIDRAAMAADFGPKTTGLIYFAVVALLLTFLSTPFRIYGKFVIEERFGFNRMTFRLWVVDLLKALAIGAALGAPALLGVLWFMEVAQDLWWVYASIFTIGVTLFLQMIFPTLIAPWFNEFTPLEDGPLKEAVTDMARRIDFRMGGIYQIDASRRSRHGNAYFAGFGKSRRIVLFDTLTNSLSVSELVAVLAHEMGHWKLNHVLRNLALAAALQVAGFYGLSVLMSYGPFYEAFGFAEAAHYRALAVFVVCAGPFMFLLTPLFAALSRRYEYQADRFAVRATGGQEALANALMRLGRDNLTNLAPHPWYSFFHYSHPPLIERLEAIDRLPQETLAEPGPT